ncbi:MAG: hypothetical protein PVJ49_20875 [Acidobacteriota bacterium]
MFGRISLATRLIGVLALALACPHPVSFREGGYLPVAVILTILGDEPIGGFVMLAFCLLLYGIPLLALSFVFLAHKPRGDSAVPSRARIDDSSAP